jgi:hypothetical protein
MSLDEIWKESLAQIREKRVDQIIGFAGDGKLGDKNSAPAEFRAFLKRVPAVSGFDDDCVADTAAAAIRGAGGSCVSGRRFRGSHRHLERLR